MQSGISNPGAQAGNLPAAETPMRETLAGPAPRRVSVPVKIGSVTVGGGAPVVVQSMTNTDTADIDATVAQVSALARAGSEIVRITVDRDEAAAAVPRIRDRLARIGCHVPLVGDFHYIGHKLLSDHPACAEALEKYRINPGNVGFKDKKDRQFIEIIEMAIRYSKPVRIGVNWGSLDQVLLTRLMDENAANGSPLSARDVTREAIIQSALHSAALAEETGLHRNRIILSAKVSQVQDLIAVYSELARRSDHALHLGLTEAGMGSKGIVASSAAMGIVLQAGIGDTDPHYRFLDTTRHGYGILDITGDIDGVNKRFILTHIPRPPETLIVIDPTGAVLVGNGTDYTYSGNRILMTGLLAPASSNLRAIYKWRPGDPEEKMDVASVRAVRRKRARTLTLQPAGRRRINAVGAAII